MFRRFRGLMIILRVLMPFLLVAGLALATWMTARSVVDATREYGDRLGTQLDEIKRAVDEANDGLEAVGGFVVATAGAAESLFGRVTDLADSVTIPLPQVEIPDFTIPVVDIDIDLPDFELGTGDLRIPIPGVAPLKSLAGDLVNAGRRAAEPVTKLAELAKVPPHLEQAAEDTAAYAAEVRTTMATWLKVVLILLVVAALAWVAAQARPTVSELSRGFSMLLGRAPVGQSEVADLHRRLSDLQRRVAALE